MEPASKPIRPSAQNPAFLDIDHSMAQYLVDTPVYVFDAQGKPKLIKPGGVSLKGLTGRNDPRKFELVLVRQDREKAAREIQQGMMDGELKRLAEAGDMDQVREVFVILVENTILEPKVRMLRGMSDMVGEMVEQMHCSTELMDAFRLTIRAGSHLAEHSVNVMTVTLGIGLRMQLEKGQLHGLALSSILHDVGMGKLPANLRDAQRELSDDEFALMKRHTSLGV